MAVAARVVRPGLPRVLENVNTRYHRIALGLFMALVLAHLAEHVAQAIQIYGLGWAPPDARGVLGMPFPWLVSSESLHYGYAIVMLIGLIALRPGFVGASRSLWDVALGIQIWHHFEHALLLGQSIAGRTLFGAEVPTSIAQLVIPRVELHLLYNALVLVPMVVAMVTHRHPSDEDRAQMTCTCAAFRATI
ncbi:MAG: hypothetical protein ACRDKT_03355 [Actinomycetota bacterium]